VHDFGTKQTTDTVRHIGRTVSELSARQQPEWGDPEQARRVHEILTARPPLVRVEDVLELRGLLARVAAGEAEVLQAGDCAEDPDECEGEHVRRKASLLHLLAATLEMAEDVPVLRVGRVAGQFAKPRSEPVEQVDGQELPVYRGHMVNSPEPDAEARQPDPLRMLTGLMAATDVMDQLGWRGPATGARPTSSSTPVVWTSHEALLLDYEVPMVRQLPDGRAWLSSTHWPWIGDRTRQPDGAHVALLSNVLNPIACKIGPGATPDDVRVLCERLDPGREPGRLTFIARLGAGKVSKNLPPLVEAAHAEGHPVIWMTDPMHGNTVTGPQGRKTRLLEEVQEEVRRFRAAVEQSGGVAGGLHLEATPEDVTECVQDQRFDELGRRYTTFCDPRLNPRQAVAVVSAWAEARGTEE
jgi:3-deoxy-7-phosphoheptulonate synthase